MKKKKKINKNKNECMDSSDGLYYLKQQVYTCVADTVYLVMVLYIPNTVSEKPYCVSINISSDFQGQIRSSTICILK